MSPADDPRDLPPAEPRGRPVTIEFEGRPLRAFEGEPLAVALFAEGVRVLGRSPKYHRPRGLFCLEGHCASCFLRIDGRPNRRACLVPAAEGRRCERQNAFPDAEFDLLRAADWLFPRGMDHHRLMTGTRLGNELFLKLVRQMGGSGTLPDAPPDALPPVERRLVDACVVGAGPAGLAAAAALARARPGATVLVVDEQDRPGGSLLAEPGGLVAGRGLAEAARAAGVHLLLSSTVIAHYPEDRDRPRPSGGPEGVLAVATPGGLLRLTARRVIYATGGYDQNLPFPESDRAGVISARACGRLVFRHGVRPGGRVLVLSDAARPWRFAATLAQGLAALGVPVEAVTLETLADVQADLRRDVIAVAALPAPASELPRQHGARVRLDPARGGYAVEVGPRGETDAAGVFAAGDVTGWKGPEEAAAEGARIGEAVARELMQ